MQRSQDSPNPREPAPQRIAELIGLISKYNEKIAWLSTAIERRAKARHSLDKEAESLRKTIRGSKSIPRVPLKSRGNSLAPVESKLLDLTKRVEKLRKEKTLFFHLNKDLEKEIAEKREVLGQIQSQNAETRKKTREIEAAYKAKSQAENEKKAAAERGVSELITSLSTENRKRQKELQERVLGKMAVNDESVSPDFDVEEPTDNFPEQIKLDPLSLSQLTESERRAPRLSKQPIRIEERPGDDFTSSIATSTYRRDDYREELARLRKNHALRMASETQKTIKIEAEIKNNRRLLNDILASEKVDSVPQLLEMLASVENSSDELFKTTRMMLENDENSPEKPKEKAPASPPLTLTPAEAFKSAEAAQLEQKLQILDELIQAKRLKAEAQVEEVEVLRNGVPSLLDYIHQSLGQDKENLSENRDLATQLERLERLVDKIMLSTPPTLSRAFQSTQNQFETLRGDSSKLKRKFATIDDLKEENLLIGEAKAEFVKKVRRNLAFHFATVMKPRVQS